MDCLCVVCATAHSSMVGLSGAMPCAAGMLMDAELAAFDKVRNTKHTHAHCLHP